jgi:hypothetical protein
MESRRFWQVADLVLDSSPHMRAGHTANYKPHVRRHLSV